MIAPALIAVLLGPPGPEPPRGACERAHAPWLERCRAAGGPATSVVVCPPGAVVVRVQPLDPSEPFDVELGAASRRSFRVAGSVGISPVGEFPDWYAEPEPRQAAFDALATCVENEASFPFGPTSPDAAQPAQPEAAGQPGQPDAAGQPERTVQQALSSRISAWPWRVALAALAWLLAFVLHRRSSLADPKGATEPRAAPRTVLLFISLLSLGTWVLRLWLRPLTFFHQNGQGPIWIETALHDQMGMSAYGPGYAEVFAGVASLRPLAPDQAIFIAMSIAGAFLPVLAWGIVRALGGSRLVAAVAAMVVALDAVLGRSMQSESYFALIVLATFAASMAIATTNRRAPRSAAYWLLLIGAGFMCAQVVRVHPLAWAPVATLPGIALLRPAPSRERVAHGLATTAVLAVIVGVSSGPAIATMIDGALGRQWMPGGLELRAPGPWGWLALAALAALASMRRPREAGVWATMVFAALLLTHRSAFVIGGDAPWYHIAWAWSFAPVLFAALAVALPPRDETNGTDETDESDRSARRSKAATLGVAAAGVLVIGNSARSDRVPTDALEQGWALEWRTTLPRESIVVHLARVDRRVLRLPLYGGQGPEAFRIHADHLPKTLRAPLYYYRSSLCFTEAGQPACAELEAGLELRPILTRSFPAIPSHPMGPLLPGPLELGLYEISDSP